MNYSKDQLTQEFIPLNDHYLEQVRKDWFSQHQYTVPNAELINHDLDLVNTHHFNCMGNRLMRLVLSNDTEHKIDTWCFGHYHRSVDRIIDNVRYVNNCRGRGDTEHRQHVYYPKRIEIAV